MTPEALFATILMPARWLMETVGLRPTDIQVWALMVALFMFALLGPTTYGDLVLMRRQRRATGMVVSIDASDEVSSPRIGFRDESGRAHEFDSPLGVNRRTAVIGGKVEVIYDPLDPKRAREANRVLSRMLTALLWYGFAIGLAIYAIAGGG